MKKFIETASLKRSVLIVEDEFINREILGSILSGEYEVAKASNGQEALDILGDNNNKISLVLLDLLMPVMDGFTFLSLVKSDPKLKRIPVIVMTSEKDAEVRSIRLGAADFITKPYDMPEVILARCERIIELSEDKSIISSTERDSLTGLYSKEFFFEYVRKTASLINRNMDAVVLNIDRFHLVNELYGRRVGDEVLRGVSKLITDCFVKSNGFACRAEADNFYVYCERRDDYDSLLSDIQNQLSDLSPSTRIRLRTGINQNTESSQLVETWFDRAKIACDLIRGDYMRSVEIYSDELHERSLYHERLINDIGSAIKNRDLVVYFQPKFVISGSEPRLGSAEALVRWKHPELGMISPGDFIPLFESNGLISMVDNYVWEETASQIRKWDDEYGFKLPVSMNVSRVNLYDMELENKLLKLLESYGLTPGDCMLEITETACADNSVNPIKVIESLREKGFKIEMDDFGSGYSSLNMLTTIPIDVLKMDIKFIRNMTKDEKSLRLVELILDIAKFLDLLVVAEGVEDKTQLDLLKKMGCDIIQGYYFSKPLPPEDFVRFIEAEKQKRLTEV